MNFSEQFKEHLLRSDQHSFEAMALQLFDWQIRENIVYRTYVNHLRIDLRQIHSIHQIPCLPISFFKHHRINSESSGDIEQVFVSSGTTGQLHSKHYVRDVRWYQQISERIFNQQWGALTDYHIFALLPSYLERNNSSLAAMADYFIRKSQSDLSGFHLQDLSQLVEQIEYARSTDRKVLLLGVTFALLNLAEQYSLNWPDVIVMETGGMKGRGRESTRAEVHRRLIDRLGVKTVASEYGMTELLSQAYALQQGQLQLPFSMKVFIRDMYDPFTYLDKGERGGINIIDLANVDSCAFIETSDLGTITSDGQFEVIGRFDNSDLRGCNLMV